MQLAKVIVKSGGVSEEFRRPHLVIATLPRRRPKEEGIGDSLPEFTDSSMFFTQF
jgi:hypothetical protein